MNSINTQEGGHSFPIKSPKESSPLPTADLSLQKEEIPLKNKEFLFPSDKANELAATLDQIPEEEIPSFSEAMKTFNQLSLELIQTLQVTCLCYANELKWHSEKQKRYTEMINELPVFSASDPLVGGTSEKAVATRQFLNATAIPILRDTISSLRAMSEETAKSITPQLTRCQPDSLIEFNSKMLNLTVSLVRLIWSKS